MSLTVCLSGRGNLPPVVGGHLWVYLNWALGLRALGCRVIWLEVVDRSVAPDATRERAAALRSQLEGFGLAQSLALEPKVEGYLDLDAAAEADLVLDLGYCAETETVRRFRKSALVDIDPGLTQCWISEGQMAVAPHDVYFTIGETVGTPAARFPDCGLRWHYTPPPVFIPAWSPAPVAAEAPYTTVSSWWGGWMLRGGESYSNEKRSAFLECVELPSRISRRLELAIALGGVEEEQRFLERHGWIVREASEVSATADQYRAYIRSPGVSSAALSRPSRVWLRPGSATGPSAISRPASRRSSSTPVPAVSCLTPRASSVSTTSTKPPPPSRPRRLTTSATPVRPELWPRSISMPKRSSPGCSSGWRPDVCASGGTTCHRCPI